MILGLRCATSAQDFKDPLELSKAVISAAGQNDRSRLEALLISESEFLRFVAPKLRMRNRSVPEFASYKRASDEALDLLLLQLGGQNWKILKIAIPTVGDSGQKSFPKDFFGSGPLVTLEGQGGHEWMLRPIGAILGHNRIYKVITYSADPKLF
jgi:hypothetical protein